MNQTDLDLITGVRRVKSNNNTDKLEWTREGREKEEMHTHRLVDILIEYSE